MRHVGPSRVELGTRTVFNLLGPLCNPAGVKHYMLGVFAREWVEPLAHVLHSLSAEAAWVVHGTFGENGGLDELTTTGTTYVAELKGGHVRPFQIEPADFKVDPADRSALLGGAPEDNARALRRVLEGELSPFRDVVIMNAGAALIVAGKTALTQDAADLARESIDSGRALAALDRLVQVSNG
jgi:anthranilate phosphoribosyltransferase